MCIVPAKVDSDFGWTDVFEVSVVKCSSSEHSQWIGFDTANSTKG